MSSENEIYEYLKKEHAGKENAVFSKDLEQRFSLFDRSLRRAISALRKEGCPICSGSTGYYVGKSRKETERTSAWLNELAGGIADSGKTMEKIAKDQDEQVFIIVIGGDSMEEWEELFEQRSELAGRLVRFFEENDTYAQERAKEEAAAKDILQEAMQMLNSSLLVQALLRVLERMQREEPNIIKRTGYRQLEEDLKSFYRHQKVLRQLEEMGKNAQRDHIYR